MRIWSRKDAEGYGRWGIRQNWMDNRKSISSQLLKGYTHNLSNQTKVSRRAQFSEQKTCPEIQVYFLRTLLTYLGKTKSCTSFSFGRLVVTALTDIHQTSKPGDRAPTGRTLCVQISTCLAFTWLVWGIQRFCPMLKSSDCSSCEEVSPSTKCMASVKCTSLWIFQITSISRKIHRSRQCPSSQMNADI